LQENTGHAKETSNKCARLQQEKEALSIKLQDAEQGTARATSKIVSLKATLQEKESEVVRAHSAAREQNVQCEKVKTELCEAKNENSILTTNVTELERKLAQKDKTPTPACAQAMQHLYSIADQQACAAKCEDLKATVTQLEGQLEEKTAIEEQFDDWTKQLLSDAQKSEEVKEKLLSDVAYFQSEYKNAVARESQQKADNLKLFQDAESAKAQLLQQVQCNKEQAGVQKRLENECTNHVKQAALYESTIQEAKTKYAALRQTYEQLSAQHPTSQVADGPSDSVATEPIYLCLHRFLVAERLAEAEEIEKANGPDSQFVEIVDIAENDAADGCA